MKKALIIILVIILLGVGGYFGYVKFFNNSNEIPKIAVEENVANISEYYIYGNHFNLKGTLDVGLGIEPEDVKMVLYNGEFKEVTLNYSQETNTISFNISDYINDGLYLDDIDPSDYFLFIRLYLGKKEDKDVYKYYILKNETNYATSQYYTMSYIGNKIDINSDNEYGTMMFKVSKKGDSNVYDIVIDPGHGGMDGGASAGGYKETDFTYDLSSSIKEELEKLGLKVKLTWDKNTLGSNDLLDEYGEHGRAVIPGEVQAKYTFCVHINKNVYNYVNGLEVYTADKINYDFAKNLANNIVNETGLSYSKNKLFKQFDGVYTHNFTTSEVQATLSDYEKKNYKPYDVTVNSNYLYMIRETGGFMTGAYVDTRNEDKVGSNPYYNSNIGSETYLMELGYISNDNDRNNLINNKDKYVMAIVNSIKTELGM